MADNPAIAAADKPISWRSPHRVIFVVLLAAFIIYAAQNMRWDWIEKVPSHGLARHLAHGLAGHRFSKFGFGARNSDRPCASHRPDIPENTSQNFLHGLSLHVLIVAALVALLRPWLAISANPLAARKLDVAAPAPSMAFWHFGAYAFLRWL